MVGIAQLCQLLTQGADIAAKALGTVGKDAEVAQILTPVLSGFFLEHFSYATLFPYAAIFMAIAFCTMLMVKHGDVKPMRKKDLLESFDAGDE